MLGKRFLRSSCCHLVFTFRSSSGRRKKNRVHRGLLVNALTRRPSSDLCCGTLTRVTFLVARLPFSRGAEFDEPMVQVGPDSLMLDVASHGPLPGMTML